MYIELNNTLLMSLKKYYPRLFKCKITRETKFFRYHFFNGQHS